MMESATCKRMKKEVFMTTSEYLSKLEFTTSPSFLLTLSLSQSPFHHPSLSPTLTSTTPSLSPTLTPPPPHSLPLLPSLSFHLLSASFFPFPLLLYILLTIICPPNSHMLFLWRISHQSTKCGKNWLKMMSSQYLQCQQRMIMWSCIRYVVIVIMYTHIHVVMWPIYYLDV